MTEIPDADLAEQIAEADPAEAEPAGPSDSDELPEIDEDALLHANEADVVEQNLLVPDIEEDYR